MAERKPRVEVRAYLCRDTGAQRTGVLAWVRPARPGPGQSWSQKLNPRTGMVLSSLATPRELLDYMEEHVAPGGCQQVTLVLRPARRP